MEGILIYNKGKIQVKGEKTLYSPRTETISPTILKNPQQFHNAQIEFELERGQPVQVRPKGQPFQPPPPPPQTAQLSPDTTQLKDFRNPYNFAPALPRPQSDIHFGDGPAISHEKFHLDRFTGQLTVEMTAKTPLLVPDAEGIVSDETTGHKTYGLRTDADGLPWIASSSVRGMLRSAYEIVTNSRYGVFPEEHKVRLAYRMDTKEGLNLIPARVEDGQFQLYSGYSEIGIDGAPTQGGAAYSAWLHRYENGKVYNATTRFPDGKLPAHGEAVSCWIEKFQHWRWSQKYKCHERDFSYWQVRSIFPGHCEEDRTARPAPPASAAPAKRDDHSHHQPLGEGMKWVKGFVCVNNANINRKHDERVFFQTAKGTQPQLDCSDEHKSKWKELIENYQKIHEKDMAKRKKANQLPDKYLDSKPGKTAFSRHVYTAEAKELIDGTLCFVRLNSERNQVEEAYPVMISRRLFAASPWELLHESLRPANSLAELSMGDRVWGWVRPGKNQDPKVYPNEKLALKSRVRVGPVKCISALNEAMECFTAPLPLAILAAPKPQQARFYVGGCNGFAQQEGLAKAEVGYQQGKRLRGRKVYPYQEHQNAHWEAPSRANAEYRRLPHKGKDQDDQNRSIRGWVKPGAKFQFSIYVENLSDVELGALLWLLQRPENQYFRFGGGKPFGFGSVQLRIVGHELRTGNDLQEYFQNLEVKPAPDQLPGSLVEEYKKALLKAYSYPKFEEIPFIAAFCRSLAGYEDNLAIHYPRRQAMADPEGKSYEWFTGNEKLPEGLKLTLQDLVSDTGFPYRPVAWRNEPRHGAGRRENDNRRRNRGRR